MSLTITVGDVQDRANPLGEEGLATIGDGPNDLPTRVVKDTIYQVVDMVESSAPELYTRLFDHVDGEKCVEDATAGQTMFYVFGGRLARLNEQLVDVFGEDAEKSTVSNVFLYLNYGQPRTGQNAGYGLGVPKYRREYGSAHPAPYSARSTVDRMPASRYSVNGETGLVTLTLGLAQGETVNADYDHTAGARSWYLRKLTLDLIMAQLIETLPQFAERMTDVDNITKRATAQFLSMTEGTTGLAMFDRLKLVDETRTYNKTARLPKTGGW